MLKKLALSSCAVLATSCGGGGNGGSTQPNSAPIFTSASAVSVVENSIAALQVTATDAENQAVTLSISGGADASRFAISATGALTFANAPNFEAPVDADGDNVYQVTVEASDGRATTSQMLNVTVNNSREGIAVRRLFTGFNQPVAMSTIPGDTRLLVAERSGAVWFFDPATNNRTLFLNVRIADFISTQPRAINALLAISVGRSPQTQRLRMFAVVETLQNDIVLLLLDAGPSTSAPVVGGSSILSILRATNSEPPSAVLTTDANNVTYLATSDAGGPNDRFGTAQNDSLRLGKLIRITDNADPFAGASAAFFSFDTLAKGLRQPRSLALLGSDILVGDQGQSRFGEINRVSSTARNLNLGWPFREGNIANLPSEPAGFTDPVLQVAFGNGPKQGNAILIGQVFTNSASDLRDKLVFSDANGTVWTVPTSRLIAGATSSAADFERRNEDFAPDLGSISGIVGSAMGNDGRAYIIDSDGEVFEIVAAP